MWRPVYVAEADALRLELIARRRGTATTTPEPGRYGLCADVEAGDRIRARRAAAAEASS